MKKIVSIRLADSKAFRINFTLTTACPYACRYCPDELHTGQNLPIDLGKLEQFFGKFADRNIYLTLTGGECTLHPQFKDVVALAKKLNIKTSVDTNSVRTVRFYEELGSLADVWNITLHPSQHELDLDKVRVLTKQAFVVVYVMMDPDFWNTAINWIEQLHSVPNIKIIPLRTISDWAGAKCSVIYTQQELDYLNTNPYFSTFTPERTEELKASHSWLSNTDSTAMYNNHDVETLDPYLLVKNNQNHFKDWMCRAGNESVLIRDNGSAIWANCGIKTYNDYSTIEPAELSEPVVCNRNSCDCTMDIRSTKYKQQHVWS